MKASISLDVLEIAQPCPVSWDDMRGDEQVRFCKHCSLHVYNISEMTRDAAQQLIAQNEGRMCVRMYRRADGTVISRDCGWQARLKHAGRRTSRWAMAAVSVVLCAALAPLGLGSATEKLSQCDVKKPDESTNASVKQGEIAVMAVGMIAPPHVNPQPPATRPATQPATQPVQ